MPFGLRVRQLVAAQQVAASQLDGVDAHAGGPRCRAATSRASDSNCHGPRYAVRPTVFVYTDLGDEAGAWACGTGRGTACPTAAAVLDRPRRRVGAARPARGRGARPGCAPSSSNAMRTSPCSWRDCPAARRFSRRSSIHFSGAPAPSRAASMRHISSRWTHDLLAEPAAGVAHDDPDAVLGDARAGGRRTAAPRAAPGSPPRSSARRWRATSRRRSPRVSIGTAAYACW